MIWIIRIIMAVGFCVFLLGFIKEPNTYAGEQLADKLMLWVVAFAIELVAGVLYVLCKL